jgi:hypothetical protein
MEDDKYWRSRASDMRERAARIRDPFVSDGFLALAEQYDLLAQDGARWIDSAAPLYYASRVELLSDEPLPAAAKKTHS